MQIEGITHYTWECEAIKLIGLVCRKIAKEKEEVIHRYDA